MSRSKLILIALAAIIGLTLPWWGNSAFQNIMTKVYVAGLFAMSFNLLWGMSGLLSFGQAAYFGLGAFAAIFAMGATTGIPLPFVPIVGGIAGMALGVVAGWVASRRSGIHFALITFAVASLVASITYQWDDVFGGESGVRARREDWFGLDFQSPQGVYLFVFLWLGLCLAAIRLIQRSPFGNVMKGIRDQEERLAFLGYDTHKAKTVSFAMASFFSGVAGALLAVSNEAASFSLFASHESTTVVLNTVIGGAGVFFGPMLGAAITTLFGYYAGFYSSHWSLYLGLIFIAVVLFAPKGVTGTIDDAIRDPDWRSNVSRNLLKRVLVVVSFSLSTVLLVEIVGTVTTPAYQVQRQIARGEWPPVPVFGIEWSPFSPATILVVLGGYLVCALLSGIWLPAARSRITGLVGGRRSRSAKGAAE